MVAADSSANGRASLRRAARTIRLGSRLIGDGQPCFVIAEGGVNHNGDPALAHELVRIAADCGADAVKFQKRTVADILTREALEAPYVKPNSLGATYGEHREKLELTEEVWRSLRELALGLGIEFMGSAWDQRSADFLEEIGTVAFKVASADVTNLELLDYTARKGRPVILSTGMSTIQEVDAAVEAVLRHTSELILLQCTSTYPAEFKDLHLRVMDTYRQRYGVLVGYSGHERGIAVSAVAAALGACVVERHFTRDRTLPGPDHAASLEPVGLEKLVRDIRHVEEALGSSEKSVVEEEWPVRQRLAKSVAARVRIPAGTVIESGMLALKGPGSGIAANQVGEVIGRVAAREVQEDTLLPAEALSWQRSR